jgi:hypothetical protein
MLKPNEVVKKQSQTCFAVQVKLSAQLTETFHDLLTEVAFTSCAQLQHLSQAVAKLSKPCHSCVEGYCNSRSAFHGSKLYFHISKTQHKPGKDTDLISGQSSDMLV